MAAALIAKPVLSTTATASVVALLRQRFGERVTTATAILEQHGKDESYHAAFPPDAVFFAETTEEVRDAVLQATNDSGIMTRPSWTLMHRLKPYQACPRAPLPVSEDLEQQIINIPSSAFLV